MSDTIVRHLRTLEPPQMRSTSPRAPGVGPWVMIVTVVAVLYHFFMGSNVLRVLLGEAPDTHVNPANVMMLLVVVYLITNGSVSLHRLCRQSPGLVLFTCSIPLFIAYTVAFNGFSGAGFYFDSFWAPAFAVIAMQSFSDRQKRFIGKLLLAIILGNALFALEESVTKTNLFPYINDAVLNASQVDRVLAETNDFRANAFYSHPLTGSLVTALGLFMILSMRLRFWVLAPSFLTLFLGLLAFGGRTGLVVAGVATAVLGIWTILSGLVRRNLRLDTLIYMLLAALVLPIVLGYIITQTTIAERIIDTFYLDDSAEIRVIQWHVLRYLDLKNWLFGVPLQDVVSLKWQAGIGDTADIENPWLLIFLNLGAIGFLAFLGMLAVFLRHIAKCVGGFYGWGLMIAGLIIDSGSNSLGVKSNDLVIEAMMLVAMMGWRNGPVALRSVRVRSRPRGLRTEGTGLLAAAPVLTQRGLGLLPVPAMPGRTR